MAGVPGTELRFYDLSRRRLMTSFRKVDNYHYLGTELDLFFIFLSPFSALATELLMQQCR